jgi:arabinogalactan endo-1,4-beta-galactosidase
MPEYVQVGNEITSGFLWPLGKVSGTGGTPWSQFGQLMKAAVQGIQHASGAAMPKIIIHIDRGGDWATTMWFFDNLNAQGVPYDIIGESYYTFFQGSPSSLSNCLSNTAAQYGKPIFIAEDAFPWSSACPTNWTNSLYGYPPTPAGQVSFISTVARTIKTLPNNLGAGFFYWGTEYQAISGVPEAGYNTSSFFDSSGNVLPVADAVGGMAAPLLLKPSRVGPSLRLQWPFSGAGTKLMTATGIGPSAMWSFLTDSLQTTDTMFSATVPMSNESSFYRLQSN